MRREGIKIVFHDYQDHDSATDANPQFAKNVTTFY